jgi:hypothetical protein
MAPLIFSRLALGVKKIRDRRPTHRDCFFQNCPERMVQRFGLFSRQIRSQARRMNLRPPQTFIRIDISHAAQHALIEQQRLDSRSPRPYSRHKLLRTDFQRIGPKPTQLLLERHSFKVRHAPKTPGVRVTQLAPIIEQETRMGMLLARLRSRMRRDMPRHPKMDKQRRWSAIAVGCPDQRRPTTPYSRWGHQPQQHEFSVSLDSCNLSSGQMLFQRDRIINEIRFPQRDGQNSPAENALA